MPRDYDISIDYYEILGVANNASEPDIKAAYRRLSKEWHPDLNKHRRKQAEEKIREINAAWEVLKDERKRRDYDRDRNAKEFSREALLYEAVELAVKLSNPAGIPQPELDAAATRLNDLVAQHKFTDMEIALAMEEWGVASTFKGDLKQAAGLSRFIESIFVSYPLQDDQKVYSRENETQRKACWRVIAKVLRASPELGSQTQVERWVFRAYICENNLDESLAALRQLYGASVKEDGSRKGRHKADIILNIIGKRDVLAADESISALIREYLGKDKSAPAATAKALTDMLDEYAVVHDSKVKLDMNLGAGLGKFLDALFENYPSRDTRFYVNPPGRYEDRTKAQNDAFRHAGLRIVYRLLEKHPRFNARLQFHAIRAFFQDDGSAESRELLAVIYKDILGKPNDVVTLEGIRKDSKLRLAGRFLKAWPGLLKDSMILKAVQKYASEEVFQEPGGKDEAAIYDNLLDMDIAVVTAAWLKEFAAKLSGNALPVSKRADAYERLRRTLVKSPHLAFAIEAHLLTILHENPGIEKTWEILDHVTATAPGALNSSGIIYNSGKNRAPEMPLKFAKRYDVMAYKLFYTARTNVVELKDSRHMDIVHTTIGKMDEKERHWALQCLADMDHTYKANGYGDGTNKEDIWDSPGRARQKADLPLVKSMYTQIDQLLRKEQEAVRGQKDIENVLVDRAARAILYHGDIPEARKLVQTVMNTWPERFNGLRPDDLNQEPADAVIDNVAKNWVDLSQKESVKQQGVTPNTLMCVENGRTTESHHILRKMIHDAPDRYLQRVFERLLAGRYVTNLVMNELPTIVGDTGRNNYSLEKGESPKLPRSSAGWRQCERVIGFMIDRDPSLGRYIASRDGLIQYLPTRTPAKGPVKQP